MTELPAQQLRRNDCASTGWCDRPLVALITPKWWSVTQERKRAWTLWSMRCTYNGSVLVQHYTCIRRCLGWRTHRKRGIHSTSPAETSTAAVTARLIAAARTALDTQHATARGGEHEPLGPRVRLALHVWLLLWAAPPAGQRGSGNSTAPPDSDRFKLVLVSRRPAALPRAPTGTKTAPIPTTAGSQPGWTTHTPLFQTPSRHQSMARRVSPLRASKLLPQHVGCERVSLQLSHLLLGLTATRLPWKTRQRLGPSMRTRLPAPRLRVQPAPWCLTSSNPLAAVKISASLLAHRRTWVAVALWSRHQRVSSSGGGGITSVHRVLRSLWRLQKREAAHSTS